jgi:hypothetical protein
MSEKFGSRQMTVADPEEKQRKKKNHDMTNYPILPTRTLLRSIVAGLHLAESILAAAAKRACKLALLHCSLSGHDGIGHVGTVNTGTVGKARRKLLARAGFGSHDFSGSLGALDDFARRVISKRYSKLDRGQYHRNLRRIKVSLLEDTLRIIVAALENWSCPLSQQLLGHVLDASLGALALGIEDDDLANSAGNEGIFLDWQFGESGQQVTLDIVCRHGAVVQRLQEEPNGLEQVDLGVNQAVDVLVTIEEHNNLGEELELMHGGLALLAINGVHLRGVGHALSHIFDFSIGHSFKILLKRLASE